MINRIALTASAFAVLAAAANAQAPFLGFQDNGTTAALRVGNEPADNNSLFDAGGTGYTVITSPIAASLTSLTYTLTGGPFTATSANTALEGEATIDASAAPGTITVTDSVLGKLFDVSFDFAELTAGQFAGTDLLTDNIVYSNVIASLQPYVTNSGNNGFSFEFANRNIVGTAVTYSTGGSFVSTPVPEPASMVALGLGAAAMIRRRRKA